MRMTCAPTRRSIGRGARDVEDLVSIADLAAGALAESWTVHQSEGGIPANVLVPLAQGVASKARQILAWLARDGQPLKRSRLSDRRGPELAAATAKTCAFA